ncbi:RusA family crossover junction endodeoxyribonuclease [Tissierella pigra]|uniref:RusA family crossover junction endodeoxyribonuclease n=1 Tax=Tissierella pigra TaxID=2607614 RepID=UPI001C1292B5|nr:RusA family crossover junction endodeoxyribonuclease [Tissierella pigra]MBU5424983.1 RusA family crossover junction endodeoxyribonuclease [Tissierella pigra]
MREFTVPGPPVAKGRPRLGKYTTYTPEKTVNYENLVQFSYLQKYKNTEPMEGYLKIEMIFFMPIPKSTSKKRKELMLQRKILPDKKPDYDNMAKAISDALNNIAYKDDNQIVEAHIYKFYCDEPRAEVFIENIS